jgi:predicted flap endonuclease-1-like 5' DNA nuclease
MGVENDLADVHGIGPKYAEMLKGVGVDSVKELQHRNAANLIKTLEDKHGELPINENTVAGWIQHAKEIYS